MMGTISSQSIKPFPRKSCKAIARAAGTATRIDSKQTTPAIAKLLINPSPTRDEGVNTYAQDSILHSLGSKAGNNQRWENDQITCGIIGAKTPSTMTVTASQRANFGIWLVLMRSLHSG